MFLEFSSLDDLMKNFSNDEACMQYLEKSIWQNGVISPFDATSVVYKPKRKYYYRCKNTGKNFTVKTGTIFQNTKIPLRKWFMAIWLSANHKKGISSCQLAKEIGVTQKTAWFMLHKIRTSYQFENQYILDGEVELDETFIGGKNKNRHYDKKVKNSQGRSFKDKTPVLGMLQRGGKLVCRVVESTSQEHLTPHIFETIKPTAILFTDEWRGYDIAGQSYDRRIVDHSRKQYANGDAYTNTLEGAWSHLKRSIIGVYHYVSRKYLQRYVDEFVFHYNTRELSNRERFDLFIHNIGHCITHKKLAA
jgi:transposase-like protein